MYDTGVWNDNSCTASYRPLCGNEAKITTANPTPQSTETLSDSSICCACLEASSSPGCSNSDCETAVCAQDSWCCSNYWDSLCVNYAAATHGTDCSDETLYPTPAPVESTTMCCGCVTTGTAGCDDNADCETAVCA